MITRRQLARDVRRGGFDTWPAGCAPSTPRRSPGRQRHVRLIVPFPPGGGTDAVGRIISARLSEVWGQQIVIENRGGGGSNVGSEAARARRPMATPSCLPRSRSRPTNFSIPS